jgi:hypothetical protein
MLIQQDIPHVSYDSDMVASNMVEARARSNRQKENAGRESNDNAYKPHPKDGYRTVNQRAVNLTNRKRQPIYRPVDPHQQPELIDERCLTMNSSC